MSTLGDIQSDFLSRLNRSDCSTDLATSFINSACVRLQRAVHLPSMERSQFVQAQGPVTFVVVPPDLLEVIDVYASAFPGGPPRPLERTAFRQIAQISTATWPSYYARVAGVFEIRGAVPTGGSVLVTYYGQVQQLVNPTDTNEYVTVCPDAVVYGALSLAADHFEHPSASAWESRFQQLLGEVQSDVVRLESTGGPAVVANPYHNAWSDA